MTRETQKRAEPSQPTRGVGTIRVYEPASDLERFREVLSFAQSAHGADFVTRVLRSTEPLSRITTWTEMNVDLTLLVATFWKHEEVAKLAELNPSQFDKHLSKNPPQVTGYKLRDGSMGYVASTGDNEIQAAKKRGLTHIRARVVIVDLPRELEVEIVEMDSKLWRNTPPNILEVSSGDIHRGRITVPKITGVVAARLLRARGLSPSDSFEDSV